MYTVGLQSAADAFLLSSLQVQVFLALCILFVLLLFGLDTNSGQNASHSPVFLPGSHLLAIAPFFQRRFEFLNDGFRKTGQSLFQFNMLRARPPFRIGPRSAPHIFTGNRHRRVRGNRAQGLLLQSSLRPHRGLQSPIRRRTSYPLARIRADPATDTRPERHHIRSPSPYRDTHSQTSPVSTARGPPRSTYAHRLHSHIPTHSCLQSSSPSSTTVAVPWNRGARREPSTPLTRYIKYVSVPPLVSTLTRVLAAVPNHRTLHCQR